MTHYFVLARPFPGGATVCSVSFGEQPWELTSRALFTDKCCARCGVLLRGCLAYRPLTNRANRMHRLCVGCVEGRELLA